MVQEDPTTDELASDSTMLRKKPVRKANAKTAAATKTEITAPKMRSVRGKKKDVQEQVEEEEVVEVAHPASKNTRKPGRSKKDDIAAEPAEDAQEVEPEKSKRATKVGSIRGKKTAATVEGEPTTQAPKATKTTRTGTLRGKKAAPALEDEAKAKADEPDTAAEEAKPAATTKAGSVRGRKAKVAIEEHPALPVPESKQTRGMRATATTSQPLSPKKITQVTKAAARATRSADKKPAAKSAPVKAPAKGRGTTRKRTVSDENAEVTDLGAEMEEDEDVMIMSSTPAKTRTTRARAAKEGPAAPSEASMSSRPTTPNDSPAHSIETNEDDHNEELEDIDSEAEVDEANNEVANSEDELCGPKTPMKRASPGAEARYLSSVQRTIRRYEEQERIRTPARRFHVLGSQRGTPQTQKPYCKPVPPSSEVRPMTVSRGAERAFVFRDLHEGAPSIPESGVEADDEVDLSFVPDDNIISMDATPVAIAQTPSGASSAALQLQSPPESASEAELDEGPNDAAMSYETEDEEGFVAPADIEQDPDETILTEEVEDEDMSMTPQPAQCFDTDDTVIITRRAPPAEQNVEQQDTVYDDASEDGSVIMHNVKSPRATVEAIDWQPIPREATITVNFDDLFSGARSSVRVEETESPEAQQVSSPIGEEAEDTIAGIEMDFELEAAVVEQPTCRETLNFDLEHVAVEPPSRRQTLNLNDFIDIAALAEPTQALNLDADLSSTRHEKPAAEEQAMEGSESAMAGASRENDTAHKDKLDLEVSGETTALIADDRSTDEAVVIVVEDATPHYARPTIAFDARRKSLPAISHQSPVKASSRPNTSDGASMPRIANPFSDAWWSRSRAASVANTPVKARPSTAHATPVASNALTEKTTLATPGERFPRLAPRQDYDAHAQTVAAPKRFQTPSEKPTKRRETFHRGAAGRTLASTPEPAAPAPASAVKVAPETPATIGTPITTPGERYPRLRPRAHYEKHAQTVAAPVRFQTPVRTPLKRPATTQKPDSLRKAALKANTPRASRSPMKTPLKAAAMTPGQEPLTPHPAAPLRGTVALVEVFTLEGASASAPFVALLHRLGAKTTKAWSDRVTHVVFKDGSPTTLQRVRLHNKDVEEGAGRSAIYCVNSRWVTDCDTAGACMDESDEAYAVDVAEIPRGGKRRRKSMEPSALMNLGGNIVRDRKSSARAPSFGRTPMKLLAESPAKIEDNFTATPVRDFETGDKENSGDDASSPVTPAWLSAPEQLVQQTAPINRIRKLDLPGKQEAKSRRLTFWNGGN